jgi:toxin FitB
VHWLDCQARESIRLGLSILEKGKRREKLELAFTLALQKVLEGRVLSFDESAALAAGEIAANRRRQGITVDMRDTQIAGIATAKRSTIATRNTKDFADLTVRVINPWKEP